MSEIEKEEAEMQSQPSIPDLRKEVDDLRDGIHEEFGEAEEEAAEELDIEESVDDLLEQKPEGFVEEPEGSRTNVQDFSAPGDSGVTVEEANDSDQAVFEEPAVEEAGQDVSAPEETGNPETNLVEEIDLEYEDPDEGELEVLGVQTLEHGDGTFSTREEDFITSESTAMNAFNNAEQFDLDQPIEVDSMGDLVNTTVHPNQAIPEPVKAAEPEVIELGSVDPPETDNSAERGAGQTATFAAKEPVELVQPETSQPRSKAQSIPTVILYKNSETPLNNILAPESTPSLETLLGALREHFPEISNEVELFLSIPQLDLEIGEDNVYVNDTMVADLIQLLDTCDSPAETLLIELQVRDRFISKLNALFDKLNDLPQAKRRKLI